MAPLTLQHPSASTFLSSSVFTKFPEKEFLSNTMQVAISRRTLTVGAVVASNEEGNWDKFLAAGGEHPQKTRPRTPQSLCAVKDQEHNKGPQKANVGDNVSLDSLDYIPYLTNEGKIVNCSSKVDVKSTIYAVFDEAKTLQYVGVTKEVYPRMKRHFAREPSKCFYVKIKHIPKSSRSLPTRIRDNWIAENGVSPPGNDDGEQQKIWQSNHLDCKL